MPISRKQGQKFEGVEKTINIKSKKLIIIISKKLLIVIVAFFYCFQSTFRERSTKLDLRKEEENQKKGFK